MINQIQVESMYLFNISQVHYLHYYIKHSTTIITKNMTCGKNTKQHDMHYFFYFKVSSIAIVISIDPVQIPNITRYILVIVI